jgi:hypothetical protein
MLDKFPSKRPRASFSLGKIREGKRSDYMKPGLSIAAIRARK